MSEQKEEPKPQPGDFKIEDLGRVYNLPTFKVKDGEGLVPADWNLKIAFVRGSKDPEEKIHGTEGIVHESLLEMQIKDLQHKERLVPSDETKEAIKKLREALMWIRARSRRREEEGTKGTYKE